MTKKQREARITELVEGNNLSELKDIAEGLEVATSGTKQEIAERIVEAEATKSESDDEETNETEKADETPSTGDAGSLESRLSRAENSLQILTEQFMAHTHGRNGALQVGEITDTANEMKSQATQVDQTKEAEMRQKALAKRNQAAQEGRDVEAPLDEDDDDEKQDAKREK